MTSRLWTTLASAPAGLLLSGALGLLLAGLLGRSLATRRRGTAGSGWLAAGVAVLVAALATPGALWLWAGRDAGLAPLDPALRRAALDVDATVPLAPTPDCRPRIQRHRRLAAGAHPRLDPAGAFLWFDAPGPDGRRQIQRLELARGQLSCWTCGEAGNNRRPAPSPGGASVVFDTDRFAGPELPNDTELMWIGSRGSRPRLPARRLSFHPEADDHPVFAPGGTGLAWRRGAGGRISVVLGAIEAGHGGLVIQRPRTLYRAGGGVAEPLAWANDGRSLAFAVGNGLGSADGLLVDPATGRAALLSHHLAPGSVSFSADGSILALATTSPRGIARWLPRDLGFGVLLLREPGVPPEPARSLGTTVRLGPTRGELETVDLGGLGAFGAPMGLSLAADARSFVLGQRAADGRERILQLELDCKEQ